MSSNTNTGKKRFQGANMRTFTMIGLLVVMWILFSVLTGGSFIATRNISNLFRQLSVIGILGTSMVLVIVINGIDLSCGSLCGLISIIAAVMMAWHHWGTGISIIVLILIGIALGALTGFLIAYLKIPAFITTLALQMIYKGLILAIGRGVTITPMNDSFLVIGNGYLTKSFGWILAVIAILGVIWTQLSSWRSAKKYGLEAGSFGKLVGKIVAFSILIALFVFIMNDYNGIPFPVVILLLLVLIFSFVSTKTQFGRNIYSIGGNETAARFSGINVKRNVVAVYLLNGLMASIAGIVLAARMNAGMPNAGANYELDAIAAAVIGGASMSGGVGHVAGAILGALFMSSIDNGMSLLNLDQYWQYMIKGLILLVVVCFDMRSKGSTEK